MVGEGAIGAEPDAVGRDQKSSRQFDIARRIEPEEQAGTWRVAGKDRLEIDRSAEQSSMRIGLDID